MANDYFFTSESVSEGHPDKVADQISDSILDAILAQDPTARVAAETLCNTGLVVLAGEITTNANVDYIQVARNTLREIGYDNTAYGIDYKGCAVLVAYDKQSPDIAQGVDKAHDDGLDQGAGDQGLMFGYACMETKNYMPSAIYWSHRIVEELATLRKAGTMTCLGPDAKSQVTFEYNDDGTPKRIAKVVCSTQHSEDTDINSLRLLVKEIIRGILPKEYVDANTEFYINPTGRFVIGGPDGDTGLTGRKIIVDTYGGYSPHGGGAFSGKDPTKVDRSAAYMMRYIAKNIVASGRADWATCQVSYAIGLKDPMSFYIETEDSKLSRSLTDWVRDNVDLTPKGIIDKFNLFRPIYSLTTNYGHFGKPYLPWEEINLF